MATSFYKGFNTYVIFAEDSAFGSPGTPTGSDYVDKVTSFSASITNGMIRNQGIGEGRNATTVVNGPLEVTGSMEWELTDPSFLQYAVVGEQQGAGTLADPYEIAEVDCVGYTAGFMPTLTLEVGSEGGANDYVLTFDGVIINTFTLTATADETVKVSADWTGRTVTSSTAVETYVPPTNRPFTFVDGTVTIGSDTVARVMSFTLTCNNNNAFYRALGSRLIKQPVTGIRRYDFTITMKLHFDDTASTLSGTEMYGYLFNGTTGGTTPSDTGENPTVGTVSVDLVEGASSGDRVVNVDLENCYIESISEPVELEGGVIELTVNGFGLAGLTDSTDKVPIRWYTIA